MDVDMNDARAEAADVIALDDPSMAVEADDDATPGSLFHGAQIVATDEDDHERPASPADASAAPAEDPIAIDGSDDDNALDDARRTRLNRTKTSTISTETPRCAPANNPHPFDSPQGKDPSPRATRGKI